MYKKNCKHNLLAHFPHRNVLKYKKRLYFSLNDIPNQKKKMPMNDDNSSSLHANDENVSRL